MEQSNKKLERNVAAVHLIAEHLRDLKLTKQYSFVYFDGSCPICSREIAYYQRNCANKLFQWVNLANEKITDLLLQRLSRDELLARFHVKTQEGQLLSGVDAFITIWKDIPGFRPMAWFAGLPGVTQFLRYSYEIFLWFRGGKSKFHKLRKLIVRIRPLGRSSELCGYKFKNDRT